ncbi:MAG: aldolase [Pseudonocardia sp.]|jgi:2-dehydro-3-deoxyphosphogluconate aldolase/(4S)-4-hydroxy-2-oxoglutarate aldolase|uniref:bifunctional 4-hydroxy-2-oxoglutarate aldolase/2-dehydro-3-deoxy-phosphogluconate aldolase n=1 Tax=Pseudonocardia sp. TaxID=60912 RepID=UPI00262B6308|nr:bifunctional 4-hydroxy-2-oxoglutarate aldolase/2-dehydro-3-deoxy-phosphogluconate aldolase [Pseudonocardia sp.]MCU1630125.1 aldolase [Pseudonocardia sp.]MDT7701486.1 2-dehydro-3-deoxyphosphogluconate aldolase / (4S)-4-hydroxy-2-oxoglutarate aldolase [Pseudonocardiales bacterium]HEV7468664.1 bifunctional 4-hydroxy-2-oxoglutarate aldolase/2-dehydro-3-deoxy-phosphogluconate aldolase [Pseudonocardia sp.]
MTHLMQDRVLAVVRAERIPDAAALCRALAAGGIRTVELTFTTPGVLDHLRAAAGEPGVDLGVGTVLTGDQAKAAIDAGATFLVTPGLRRAVADVAVAAGVPVYLGAFTPTEVAEAMDLGASAVKIFPAGRLGPAYLRDLLGPYPHARLLPSGGVSTDNAAEFLAAGASAVCAGTSVVPPAAVAAGEWDLITDRARAFAAALTPSRLES